MKDPKFVDVDGIKTRYFEAGRGDPLVLVHGGQFGSYYNAYHWSLNFDDLARHCRVFALDKLGMGFTDNPRREADYTMAAVIDHVHRFIRVLGLSNVTLVGHSRGALPVARIAVDHPEAVKSLVILDSSTLAPNDPSVPPDFYAKLEANAPRVPDEEFVSREPKANSYGTAHITKDFVQAMLEIARLPKMAEAKQTLNRLLQSQFLPDLNKLKHSTLEDVKAGRLKVPALIVWGFNDASAPLKLGLDLLGIFAAGQDQVRFHVFNRSGHYVFREHAAALNCLIVDFMGIAR